MREFRKCLGLVVVLCLSHLEDARAAEIDTVLSSLFHYWEHNTPAKYEYRFIYRVPGKAIERPVSQWSRVELSVDLLQNRFRVLMDVPNPQATPETAPRSFIEAVQNDEEFYRITGEEGLAKAVSSRLERSPDEIERSVRLDICVLVGLLPTIGESRMTTLLQSMEVSMHRSGDWIELTGSRANSDETLSLTIDPGHEFAPRRIHWKGDSVEAGETAEFVFEVTKFGLPGAPHVPAEFRTEKLSPGGKKAIPALGGEVIDLEPTKLIGQVKVESVDREPGFSDDDFRLTMGIPNGTNVYMRDAVHLRHVWQDGQPVVVVDK